MLICQKCHTTKDDSLFSSAARNKSRNGKHSYCKSCMLSYGKQHRTENIDRYKERSRAAYISTFESKLKALLRVSSADRSQLNYDEMLDMLKAQNYCCAVSGIKLTYDTRTPTTMSIDRIDPTKGYVKENVRFVCWWINVAMSNWGESKLREMINEWNNNEQRTLSNPLR